MFTGIVETQAHIRKVTGKEMLQLTVEKPMSWKLKTGASISINGICVTVVSHSAKSFICDLMPETLRRTTAKSFAADALVNLERPLKMGDELGGHVVLGHVDSRGKVVATKDLGASREISISAPQKYSKEVIEKGSVAVDGVSLTVVRKRGNVFTVALIPHTLRMTTLGTLMKNDTVNLEFDVRGRSIAVLNKK